MPDPTFGIDLERLNRALSVADQLNGSPSGGPPPGAEPQDPYAPVTPFDPVARAITMARTIEMPEMDFRQRPGVGNGPPLEMPEENMARPDTRRPVEPPAYRPLPEAPGYTAPPIYKYGDVAGAQRGENAALVNAGQAAERASNAQLASQRDLTTRLADVYQRSAEETAKADEAYQTARDAARRAGEAETADWLADVTKKSSEEPNPHRWWENQSSFSQGLWALGIAFGAAATAGNPNARVVAIDMMNKAIDQDVALQQQRLSRELNALQLRGTVLERKQSRVMSDIMDTHAMKLSRIQSLERAWNARAQVPGSPQEAAAQAQVKSQFEQMILGVTESRAQKAVAERMQSVSQAHAERMQKQAQDAALALELLRGKNELAASAAKAGAEGKAVLGTESGVVAVNAKGQPIDLGTGGGPGAPAFKDDEAMTKAGEVVAAANKKYAWMNQLADALEKQGTGTAILGVPAGEISPEVVSLVTKIGALEGRELHPGRMTDQAMAAGVVAELGFNPNSKKLMDRAKFFDNREEIIAKLRREANNLRAQTNDDLVQYNNKKLNPGGRFLWTPASVTAPVAPPPPSGAQIDQARGEAPVPPVPITTEEYRARAASEKTPGFEGSALPAHDKSVLQGAAEEFKGRPADWIRDHAKKVLDQVKSAGLETPGFADPDKLPEGWKGAQGDLRTLEVAYRAQAEDAIKLARRHELALIGTVAALNRGRVNMGQEPLDKNEVAAIANNPDFGLKDALKLITRLSKQDYSPPDDYARE